MGAPLHVLIIEDSEIAALLLILELQRGGFDPRHERVETAELVRATLRGNSWDIILCDYNLPDLNGFEALALVKETGSDILLIRIRAMYRAKASGRNCIFVWKGPEMLNP